MKRIKTLWENNFMPIIGTIGFGYAFGFKAYVGAVSIVFLLLHYGIKAIEAWEETK